MQQVIRAPLRQGIFWLEALLFAIAYFVSAHAGHYLAIPPSYIVTVVWLSGGIAIAAFLTLGRKIWPLMFVTAVLGDFNFATTNFLVTLFGSVCIGVGNTLEYLFASYFIEKWCKTNYPFNSIENSFRFILIAVILAPCIGAIFGITGLWLNHSIPTEKYFYSWLTWYMGDIIGIIVLTPTILTWIKQARFAEVSVRGIFEYMIILAAIALLSFVIFWEKYPLAYLLIPLPIWALFRFDAKIATLTGLIISFIAIFATVTAHGAFVADNINDSLILLQSFIGIVFVVIIFLASTLAERNQGFENISTLNAELENRIIARTQELQVKNNELSDTLHTLRVMQDKLIESEKLASLGGLVAGIAHEVNTPLGISITTISYLREKLTTLIDLFNTDALCKSDLEGYIEKSKKSIEIVEFNLSRAAELIASFKQTSADHTSDIYREIELEPYIQEIMRSLHPLLSGTKITIQEKCPPNIIIHSYPGVIFQVLSILLSNSVLHGYEPGQLGKIQIEVKDLENNIQIIYTDDGKGIPPENYKKIFEPFFTTARNKGGVGLGLCIAYNRVTQILKGTFTIDTTLPKGACFKITFPKTLKFPFSPQ